MTNKQEVATTSSHFSLTPPGFLTKHSGPTFGNENVGPDDVTTPLVKVIQQLSPQMNSSDPKYMEGAKAGQFLITGENTLADTIKCVSVFYRREWAVYGSREMSGGGFKESFTTSEEAKEYVKTQGGDDKSHVIKETGKQWLLLVDDQGEPITEAIFFMDGSKLYTSNDWNKAITLTKKDRFASVWELAIVSQSNAKGRWFNVKPTLIGFTDESLYQEAKGLYERVAPKMAA
jgi:hypothetical protein